MDSEYLYKFNDINEMDIISKVSEAIDKNNTIKTDLDNFTKTISDGWKKAPAQSKVEEGNTNIQTKAHDELNTTLEKAKDICNRITKYKVKASALLVIVGIVNRTNPNDLDSDSRNKYDEDVEKLTNGFADLRAEYKSIISACNMQ